MSSVISSPRLHPQPWSGQLRPDSHSAEHIIPEQESFHSDVSMTEQTEGEERVPGEVHSIDSIGQIDSETVEETVIATTHSETSQSQSDGTGGLSSVAGDRNPLVPRSGRAGSLLLTSTPGAQSVLEVSEVEMNQQNTSAPSGDDIPGPPSTGDQDIPPPPPPPPEVSHVVEPPADISPWLEIPEDSSNLSTAELKFLKDNESHSADDDEHWQRNTFTDRADAELAPHQPGTIRWTVETYNGTRESPNRDLVMYSPAVELDGYWWRLRFYPKGNKTGSYMSIYLECESLKVDSEHQHYVADPDEPLETPMPTRGAQLKKPHRLAVEYMILVYNLSDPRVLYNRHSSAGFSRLSPDHGFTRFGGRTIVELATRLQNQRAPLLQGDRLGFICHLRVVSDPTFMLFHRDLDFSRNNHFLRTGSNELSGGHAPGNGKGQLAAAILTWIMLPSFRRLLLSYPEPAEVYQRRKQPTPLIDALRDIDATLRSPVDTETNTDILYRVSEAVEKHCTRVPEHADITRAWQILGDILKKETKESPQCKDLLTMLSIENPAIRSDHVQWDVDRSDKNPKLNFSTKIGFQDGLPATESSLVCRIDVPGRRTGSPEFFVNVERLVHLKILTRDGYEYRLYSVITHGKASDGGEMFTTFVRPSGKTWWRYCGLQDRNFYPARVTARGMVDQCSKNVSTLLWLRTDGFAVHMDPETRDPIKESEASQRAPTPVDDSNVANKEMVQVTVYVSHEDFSKAYDCPGNIFTFKHERPALERVGQIEYCDGVYDLMVAGDSSLDDVRAKLAQHVPAIRYEEQLLLKPLDAYAYFSASGCWTEIVPAHKLPATNERGYFQALEKESHASCVLLHVLEEAELRSPSQSRTLGSARASPEDDEDAIMSDADTGLPVGANSDDNGTSSSRSSPIAAEEDTSSHSSDIGRNADVLVFVKLFLAEAQMLLNIGSWYGSDGTTVNGVIKQAFNTRDMGKKCLEFNERDPSTFDVDLTPYTVARECRSGNTASVNDASGPLSAERIQDGDVLVIVPVLSSAKRHAIACAGGHATLDAWLQHLYDLINHPSYSDTTRKIDYIGEDYHNGTFSKGLAHGRGDHIYTSGDKYEGDWVMGTREGKGTLTRANGDVYEGDWLDDKMHGQGTLTEARSGNRYEGGFRHGRKFGKGVTHWENVQDSVQLCAICYEGEVDCALYDCGHALACSECSSNLEQCPLCRKTVLKVLMLHFR